MGTIVVPVFQVFSDGDPQLPLGSEDHLVQTLRLDGPDEILHSRIHLRRERRQFFDFHSDGLEDHVEAAMEQRIPVMYQILLPQHEPVPHVAHVPGDLRRPVAVRIVNDAAKPDFPCAEIHEKQQTLPNQAERHKTLHLGEVHRCRHVLLRFDKLIPVAAQPAFRIGDDAVIVQLAEVFEVNIGFIVCMSQESLIYAVCKFYW